MTAAPRVEAAEHGAFHTEALVSKLPFRNVVLRSTGRNHRPPMTRIEGQLQRSGARNVNSHIDGHG